METEGPEKPEPEPGIPSFESVVLDLSSKWELRPSKIQHVVT